MKLAELNPRWIHPNVFVFRCPHCPDSGVLLSCKNIEMSSDEQHALLEKEFGGGACDVVPCKPGFSWTITGSRPSDPAQAFADNVSVTPSIDASASGHWHGFITNGEIK